MRLTTRKILMGFNNPQMWSTSSLAEIQASPSARVDAHYRPILSVNNVQIRRWACISYTNIANKSPNSTCPCSFVSAGFLAENRGQSHPLIQGANTPSNHASPCRHHIDGGPTRASNRCYRGSGTWNYNNQLPGRTHTKGFESGSLPHSGSSQVYNHSCQ